jgi:23S rRNA pseudouridine2605 synthase
MNRNLNSSRSAARGFKKPSGDKKPAARGFKKPLRDSNPVDRGFKKPTRDSKPAARGFKKPLRDSNPGGIDKSSGKKIITLKSRPAGAKHRDTILPRSKPRTQDPSAEIRLNRFIANAGVCSRREADKYISAGLVTVNGTVVSEMGVKVKMTDDIRLDGRRLVAERKVFLLLNKPKGFVTTTEDPKAGQNVMDLLKGACPERIYPVGRLDKNTTGVLLFTNDGELSDRLTHPSHRVKKIYQVTLDKSLTKNDMIKIAEGIELDDGPIAADAISYIDPLDKTQLGIEIHSGRNRIVRRIFEHLGYRVKKLDRVSFAGLTKKNVPRGKWRLLSGKEVNYLKMK